MNRRFRGASPVYPTPVTGRSTSSRLRFRFVRASEAKLCGRMWNVILIAGPPVARIHVLCVSGALGANFLFTGAWVLSDF